MVEEPKYTGGGIFVFGGYVDSMMEGDARNFAITATTKDAHYLIIDALEPVSYTHLLHRAYRYGSFD